MIERKFFIAGVQHHQMNKVINDLVEGEELNLVPEPDNKFDPNAIKIEYEGTMLGYVPKKLSAEIAAALETGSLCCMIETLNPTGKPWEWCEVIVTSSYEEEEEEDYEDIDDEEE